MRPALERLVRVGWPVPAGLIAGLAAGLLWTIAQPDRYRAEARVLVRGDARGLVPAVKALAESSLLAQNVTQTLRLSHAPPISASGGGGGVVLLSAESSSSERARQIDGEAAIVLTRLVVARFGPGAEATILDPAHTVEQTSPTPGRNLLVAGLTGVAAGIATAFALARRRPVARFDGPADPATERRLEARIDAVAKRERALARRAGELADREARLKSEHAMHEAARARTIVKEPEPEPEPEPERQPEPVAVVPARGGWNLDALEEAVRSHAAADPSQHEEWMSYLFFLREHAAADGTLPPSFDALLNEVFAPVVQRGHLE